MRRSLSVRWRLTLFYTLVVAISGAVLLALVYGLVTQSQDRSMHVDLLLPGEPSRLPCRTTAVIIAEVREEAVGSTIDQLVHNSWLALLARHRRVGRDRLARRGPGARARCTPSPPARSAISADSLDERIALGGPRDELRELADTFDALLGRVQQTVSSERRLVATMSHELRTPLANQQAALDVALADPDADAVELRAAATTALDQSRRAARTIDALLVLARAQSGEATGPPVAVDLRAAVADAVDQVRRPDDGLDLGRAPRRRHGARRARPARPGRGQPRAQRRPPQRAAAAGSRCRCRRRPDEARVVVENTGPLVPPDAAADLVLPFRRRADDRTGADAGVGLGLTVVRAVADHHGGRLVLSPRPGGGLVVELVLPAR